MVAQSRKWSAAAALAAMMLPWPATLALVLHEAEHVEAHVHLAAVLHGHDHASGTPAHDHALLPSPSLTSGHWRAFVASTVISESDSWRGFALQPPMMQRPAPSATASPPAGPPSSKSVLRI
jgi:hypothetical protein